MHLHLKPHLKNLDLRISLRAAMVCRLDLTDVDNAGDILTCLHAHLGLLADGTIFKYIFGLSLLKLEEI